MRADLLHVVTAVSNPARWKSRIDLFHQFAAHMLESGVQLHVVEGAYGDEPFEIADIPGVDHIRVTAKSHIWVKENLINIGISRLPRDWKYVAWIDADIRFRKPGWAEETLHALQHFDIIQPWEHCYDLGPNDEHLQLHNSFGRQWVKDPITCSKLGQGYTFAHPGYAWAATRHALECVGCLLEHAVLGAADHHMALALVGHAARSIPAGLSPNYVKPIMAWQDRAQKHISGNLGYLPFNIEHNWHGAKDLRKYVDRWSILSKNNFDPETDIKYNTSGVIELAGNKPQLKRDIWAYFRQRNEDSNSLD